MKKTTEKGTARAKGGGRRKNSKKSSESPRRPTNVFGENSSSRSNNKVSSEREREKEREQQQQEPLTLPGSKVQGKGQGWVGKSVS